jgi:4-amino-4-deoxy-L-arabinose transferase-like glycosyltransferase
VNYGACACNSGGKARRARDERARMSVSVHRAAERTTGVRRRTQQCLLLALILVSFVRGITALGGKSLWWDESLSVHRTRGTLAYVLSNEIVLTDNVDSIVTIDNHPPLYFLLLWVAVRLLGQSEFALRFLSVASVTLIVPLLYVTGRRLVDGRAGLAAAALGALSPMYLWYGQEARMYAFLALLSLLSFYSFLRAFFSFPDAQRSQLNVPWLAAWLLSSAAVVFTHHLSGLLIVFQVMALGALLLWRKGTRRGLVLATTGASAITLASLAYALVMLGDRARRPGFRFVPLLDLLRDLLNSFSLGLSVDVGYWYVLAIDLIFLLFLLLGIAWLVLPGAPRGRRVAGWLVVGYLLIPVAVIYGVSFVRPAYMNSRHLILLTPAFYLLVGTGLASLRGRSTWIAVLGGLVLFAAVGYSTYNYFRDPTYDKDHHREWGAYLRENVRIGDIVVVDPPHIAELYEYYAGSDVPWIGLPLLSGSREETAQKLSELVGRYDRVWLAFSHTPPWGDRRRLPQTWLNDNAFRVDFRKFESYASTVLVAAYLPDQPVIEGVPRDALQAEVRYDPSLRLEGFRTISPPEPGEMLHVELFWAVDESIPQEASVSLRLVDVTGRVWGYGEQCPFNGMYPMWHWQPGALLQDEHKLYIQPGTPPGTYQLEMVLVSRPTEDGCFGARGPSIPPLSAPPEVSRGDAVLLGPVTVQPSSSIASLDDLDIDHPRRARFDGLELLGVSYAPTELEPGERLGVSLYWQAHGSSLPDARFRLELVDSSGETRQQVAIRPAGDAYPTDRWLEGDRFKGQFWLRLPQDAPAGRYRLELVPEPPLVQSGAWAALRRVLGPQSSGITLGDVKLTPAPSSSSTTPATLPPLPAGLQVSHPMLATLGDQVRFLGYDLQSESVRAGEALSFTLYWQALRPIDVSYSVFTHLLGPSDQVLGQMDGIPGGGAHPTTLWQPGEVIADDYAFVVQAGAPPGEHPLEIGMYRLETAVRLPVTDAGGQPVPGDRILLPPILVLPAPSPSPDSSGESGTAGLSMAEAGW